MFIMQHGFGKFYLDCRPELWFSRDAPTNTYWLIQFLQGGSFKTENKHNYTQNRASIREKATPTFSCRFILCRLKKHDPALKLFSD